MSDDAGTGSARPRPLSGGFWTLLSWLRGEDHSSSSESISSAGSDRTAVSFAFLTPAHYTGSAGPIELPPPGPPTDSYKKRVRERNLRRQFDRDTTLHRKYGLFRGEGFGGYDAFSLPSARRTSGTINEQQERERRATSECVQRRSAHVPGKRRAPPPPNRPCVLPLTLGSSSINRRHARKRPAPQPPNRAGEKLNENIYILDHKTNYKSVQMSSQPPRNLQQLPSDLSMGCKSEKYTKKESNSGRVKVRSEKGFLKQIFDNRKRNSAIGISAVKVLPSISELDKQAAEIIETAKVKRSEESVKEQLKLPGVEEVWYCLKCSNKYEKTVGSCFLCKTKPKSQATSTSKDFRNASTSFTQTDKSLPNNITKVDEKQKLKDMLKEMKDSLPKKPKNCISESTKQINNTLISLSNSENKSTETPTLRIGSKNEGVNEPVPSSSKQQISKNPSKYTFMNSDEGTSKLHKTVANNQPLLTDLQKLAPNRLVLPINKAPNKQPDAAFIGNKKLHTPLKISSLLNPIYIPKLSTTQDHEIIMKTSSSSQTDPKTKRLLDKVQAEPVYIKTADAVREIILNSTVCSNTPAALPSLKSRTPQPVVKITEQNVTSTENNSSMPVKQTFNLVKAEHPSNVEMRKTKPSVDPGRSNENDSSVRNIDKITQHSRRRELINLLEKSIANGDERAAADAAMKLAQLRLSCSVLSFSSQILAESSTSSAYIEPSQNSARVHKKKEDVGKLLLKSKEGKLDDNAIQKNISKPSTSSATVNNFNNKFVNPEALAVKSTLQKQGVVNAPSIKNPNQTPVTIAAATARESKKNTNEEQSNMSPKIANNTAGSSNELKDEVCMSHLKPQLVDDKSIIKVVQNENVIASTRKLNNQNANIKVWVEDKVKARGPIEFQVLRDSTMGDLRRQVQYVLGLPAELQRWIVGRALCNDDDTKLIAVAGPGFNAPFYLCLVECDTNTDQLIRSLHEAEDGNDQFGKLKEPEDNNSVNVYTELVQLERQAIVPNAEAFECEICMENCYTGAGIVLRECVHSFCRQCLADVVRHCEEPTVSCPATGCPGTLHEREIRALVSTEDYERWLARGLAAAESGTRNAFHCRTRDCTGWALCDTGVLHFPCPVCKHTNCVPCQAIHEGETCKQHQEKLQEAKILNASNQSDEGTQALIQSLIKRGEALECPECKAVITKKWGCDWVKCSACKTEICWVTRGRRWGPDGRGDTSGGCKCGVDGKKCHPSCGYCH